MQGQAAVLKREIEAKLAKRFPAALYPIAQQALRLHFIGNAQVNGMLGGGLPLGSLPAFLTSKLDGSGSQISIFFSIHLPRMNTVPLASTDTACPISTAMKIPFTLSPVSRESQNASGISMIQKATRLM